MRLECCIISDGTGYCLSTSEGPKACVGQGVSLDFLRERGNRILNGKSIMYKIPEIKEHEVLCLEPNAK